MKLFLLVAALGLARGGEPNPALAEIKTVYLLPMTYSLDQFLAIRLTKGGVVQVVTDPKLADAILTDHIGESLKQQLDSLYADKKADKDKSDDEPQFASPMAGGTRSRGAVFLVDRKTRSVLWSDYVPPKSSQAAELNHVADKIAGQLEKDKRGKPEQKKDQ